MAYQALLFCPDERTASTVTQVLGELDFEVVPCPEPFGAVKRLMAGHFDAVVVDCENEQNATLLFKSALNSSHNQTSLAVAVVAGQADVAKAFRIGANLVLTKPINIEQAKGTLRVARGLLRKSEAARPPAPSGRTPTAAKADPPTPQRPKLVVAAPASSTPRVAQPSAPAPPFTKPVMPEEPAVASLESGSFSAPGAEADEDTDIFALPTATGAGKPDPAISAGAPLSLVESTPPKMVLGPARAAAIIGSGAGTATAPALARGAQDNAGAEAVLRSLSSPEGAGTTTEIENTDAIGELTPAPGNASTAKASPAHNKKVLLPILAVALLVMAAGFAYVQFPGRLGSLLQLVAKPAASTTVRPASGPTTVPQTSSPFAAKPSPSLTPASPATLGTTSVDSRSVTDDGAASESGSAASNSKSAHPPVSKAKGSPAAKPTSKLIVLKPKPSKSDPDGPLPSPLGMDTSDSSGTLPKVIASEVNAPSPVLQAINVSQGVSKGLILKKVQPAYPQSALQKGVEGNVDLMATISARGDVIGIKVLSGLPLLAEAATEAVKRWKYKPYSVNGAPEEFTTEITVKFRLPR